VRTRLHPAAAHHGPGLRRETVLNAIG
jgi:hypothetical protein